MAIHKLALIRYRTIDQCLQNRSRKWTLEDLIQKVSETLYEYEGISDGVSKRTIQADIQLMRSDKLGYNAPIAVRERKYYVYEEPGYSISQAAVTNADIEKMTDAVSVLRQLNGLAHFADLSDIIARLENTLRQSVNPGESPIQLEGNGLLKGLEHLMPLYQAIRRKIPLLISYQSFRAKEPRQDIYHPYLLKEYRNRWFLLAKPRKGPQPLALALDRITEILEMNAKDFIPYTGIPFDQYFADTIGVTKSIVDRPQKVVLWVNRLHAPYVLTKPIHTSQQLLSEDQTGILIRLDVVLNFELEREILGFGENIKVFAPAQLQQRIKRRLQEAVAVYEPVSRPADKMQDVHPEEDE